MTDAIVRHSPSRGSSTKSRWYSLVVSKRANPPAGTTHVRSSWRPMQEPFSCRLTKTSSDAVRRTSARPWEISWVREDTSAQLVPVRRLERTQLSMPLRVPASAVWCGPRSAASGANASQITSRQ